MILLLLETNHRYQWINETNFFKTKQNFLIGGKLLFNVILVSAIQQNESVIIIYTLLLKSPYCPPISPLQVITEPSWAPCVIQQLPTNSFIHDSVQMSMLLSHFVPLLSFTSCVHKSALYSVHQYHFSRFHIYFLIYNTCFSLSDLFHSV